MQVRARAHQAAAEEYTQEIRRLDDAMHVAADALTEATTTAELVAEIAESALLTDLAAAIEAVAGLPPAPAEDWTGWSVAELEAGARDAADARGVARDLVAVLDEITAAAIVVHEEWLLASALEGYGTARGELAAAIDADARVAASEGRVLDDAPRVTLAAVVDQAVASRDAAVDEADPGALNRAAGSARARIEMLASAEQAVVDQQAAWRAQRERDGAVAAP